MAQLHLRYALAGHTADAYAGRRLRRHRAGRDHRRRAGRVHRRIRTPERYLVVLSPTVSALEWRERQRAKEGYVHFSPGRRCDEVLRRETARIGYWLDSSAQTPDETVDDILANLERARV